MVPFVNDILGQKEKKSRNIRDEVMEMIWNTISEDSLRRNEDPVAVVEGQLRDIGPGMMMLRNFGLGFQQAVSGQPLKNVRETLYEREVKKQQIAELVKQKNIESLTSILGQQGQLDVAETNRTAGMEKLFTEQAFKSYKSPGELKKEELERTKLQSEIDENKATTEKTKKETGLLRKYKAATPIAGLMEQANERFADDPEALAAETERIRKLEADEKRKIAAAGREGKPPQFQYYESGGRQIQQAFDSQTGRLIGTADVGPAPPLAQAQQDMNTLRIASNRASAIVATVDRAIARGEKLTSKAFAIANPEVWDKVTSLLPDQFSEWIEEKTGEAPGMSSAQQELVRLHREMVAAAVRSFTGAQATNQERAFIETTLPQLFYKQNTYKQGIQQMQALLDSRFYITRFGIDPNALDFHGLYRARQQKPNLTKEEEIMALLGPNMNSFSVEWTTDGRDVYDIRQR